MRIEPNRGGGSINYKKQLANQGQSSNADCQLALDSKGLKAPSKAHRNAVDRLWLNYFAPMIS